MQINVVLGKTAIAKKADLMLWWDYKIGIKVTA